MLDLSKVFLLCPLVFAECNRMMFEGYALSMIFRADMFSICSVACSKEMEKEIWERFLKQKLLDKSHDGPKENMERKVGSVLMERCHCFKSVMEHVFWLSSRKEVCPFR